MRFGVRQIQPEQTGEGRIAHVGLGGSCSANARCIQVFV
jgi:hypothetical protein